MCFFLSQNNYADFPGKNKNLNFRGGGYFERMLNMAEEKSKYTAQMKYNADKRENLNLGLAKGTKEKWKAYAAERNMSLTEYISKLIEEDNKEC